MEVVTSLVGTQQVLHWDTSYQSNNTWVVVVDVTEFVYEALKTNARVALETTALHGGAERGASGRILVSDCCSRDWGRCDASVPFGHEADVLTSLTIDTRSCSCGYLLLKIRWRKEFTTPRLYTMNVQLKLKDLTEFKLIMLFKV